MKYYLLGKSGLRVSELALGAMSFGTEWGWGTEKNEARKMLDHYIDNGGNFVDTANVYTNGSSEKILGELLGEKRQQIVLSTKYTMNTHPYMCRFSFYFLNSGSAQLRTFSFGYSANSALLKNSALTSSGLSRTGGCWVVAWS